MTFLLLMPARTSLLQIAIPLLVKNPAPSPFPETHQLAIQVLSRQRMVQSHNHVLPHVSFNEQIMLLLSGKYVGSRIREFGHGNTMDVSLQVEFP
jgi:hypothetical protein